uniref:thioredoxin-dependent peroxiredoxin n=1 Tax=uncultured marine group II/III euryarchaeote KM3_144_H10 TaxID=1457880 RepID=A0A075GCB1_9EURY|nr:bacterioferritin comigratory protein (BCP, PRXQ, DOT5) [uncultured marine group II/III euryarchaeote KM3_144_H10]
MGNSLIGQEAPDFTLPTSDGGSFKLSDMDGSWKVLFFYAHNKSPTCKRGCLSFKEQHDLFQSLSPAVEIIGISQYPSKDNNHFKQKFDLPFLLLEDEDRIVAEAYDVPIFLGIFPAKSSFVIGPDRTIHHCYDWLFRPRKHVAKILNSLSQISKGDDIK